MSRDGRRHCFGMDTRVVLYTSPWYKGRLTSIESIDVSCISFLHIVLARGFKITGEKLGNKFTTASHLSCSLLLRTLCSVIWQLCGYMEQSCNRSRPDENRIRWYNSRCPVNFSLRRRQKKRWHLTSRGYEEERIDIFTCRNLRHHQRTRVPGVLIGIDANVRILLPHTKGR